MWPLKIHREKGAGSMGQENLFCSHNTSFKPLAVQLSEQYVTCLCRTVNECCKRK